MKLLEFQNLVNTLFAIFKCQTLSPTESPTLPPTPNPTQSLTLSPAPTPPPQRVTQAPIPESIIKLICPDVGSTPIIVTSNSKVSLALSDPETLCTLTRIQTSETGETTSIAPVARSYEGNKWETVKGPYNLDFSCRDDQCTTFIPNDPNTFYLTTYDDKNQDIGLQQQASRFLEQATFGPTIESIALLSNDQDLNLKIEDWIKDQVNNQPVTSHREYYRKRANTLVQSTSSIGAPLHACSPGSRWQAYSFNQRDVGTDIQVDKTSDDSAYLLSINDIPRAEVTNLELKDSGQLDSGKSYQICSNWAGLDGRVGGSIKIKKGSSCQEVLGGNPRLQFNSTVDLENVITLSPSRMAEFTPLSSNSFVARNLLIESKFDDIIRSNSDDDLEIEDRLMFNEIEDGNFILKDGLDDPMCDLIHVGAYPVYVNFTNGTWLALNPRLNLEENSLKNVLSDGGGSQELLGAECSNVPKTFVNIDTCDLSTEREACSFSFSFPDAEISLTTENIKKLYDLTSDYVYAIDGLRPETSPCKPDARSRWELLSDVGECTEDIGINTKTKETLATLLNNTDGLSLRDIIYTSSDTCNVGQTTPSPSKIIKIQVDSSCWKLVHQDHYSVYDMTPWVSKHPGGRKQITQFARSGEAVLLFPDGHEMSRWEDNKSIFPLLGRFGDVALYQDLPPNLQLESVAKEFGAEGIINTGEGVIVCGSPGEINNDHSMGDSGLMRTDKVIQQSFTKVQKLAVWTTIVLSASDQLRQRMAWALSQIFAISPQMIKDSGETESLVTYYDIFVRHAFGNFRDILKEVAYSPVMGKMLSYRGSKSSAYLWKRFRVVYFADENFAREVMQLFTIGIIKLNMDGTPVMNVETNTPVLSYTNDHIMSYARAWTGFETQGKRGNIEIYTTKNLIDPMQIIPEWRDIFPKIDLSNGYIGDGYPLCVDMPDKSFLRKNAKYRSLGSSTLLELQSNLPGSIDAQSKSFTLLKSSKLYEELCKPTTEGGTECTWQTEVVLADNLACVGQECDVDTVRLVQVTDNVFFEYVHPPCVMLSFFSNAKKISSKNNNDAICADPRLPQASEACCQIDSTISEDRNCEYVGERVTYSKAVGRCTDIGQQTCNFRRIRDCTSECCSWIENLFWHDASCQIQIKVDGNGYAAIVYQPEGTEESKVHNYFRKDTINFFPVYWRTNRFPSSLNGCGSGVCDTIDDGCICNTTLVEGLAFDSMPDSVSQILSELHIGSFSPDIFDAGNYSAPIESGDIKAYLGKSSSFDIDTIFEINVHNQIKYYRNIRSNVFILDKFGQTTSFEFRNPPHFMNFAEEDIRDAYYETDAVLDSYFYNNNTAPFVASLLIQRFGISNPSPGYVKRVANAFIDGKYGSSFGSGRYGDLAATIAAILLDNESRSTVLSMDPAFGSLREPLLKLIGFMRSMNFEAYSDYPEILLSNVSDLIGQMAHAIIDVFSFFRQDFATIGPIQDASLVAPEGQRYLGPTIVGLLNGLFSMSKYGLTSCNGGFGQKLGNCNRLLEGDFSQSKGNVTYSPTNPSDAVSVVDEMAMLLTAGRLNQETRKIIQNEYSNAIDQESGLRLAQQLIVTSPEFHSTNFVEFSGSARKKSEVKPPTGNQYKSMTYLLLSGGIDSYNILVPHSGCKDNKDMFAEYESVRAEVALSKSELLEIDSGNNDQVCSKFGIHSNLPVLKSLYDSGEALFFANTGVLFEPVTKETWQSKTNTQLFAHNIQQRDTMQVDAFQEVAGTGVLGRMADTLTKNGYSTGSFVMSDDATSLVGEPSKSPAIISFGRQGIQEFNPKPSIENMSSLIADVNNLTKLDSGLFGKTWSDYLNEAIGQTGKLIEAFDGIELNETFPTSNIGKELDKVALSIKARNNLNTDRQFFMTTMGGYDSHANVNETLYENLPILNDALESFVKEMKIIGEWENVILMVASDFGRTLTPNSGEGTDHAWGGNYFMIGGALNGGKILGKYPDNLTSDGPLILKRGRVIPTTSWDSIMNGVAKWMGIKSESDLNKVLPNRKNFAEDLFDELELFR